MARYSQLQPLLHDELSLISTAMFYFFSVIHNEKIRKELNLPITPQTAIPLTIFDFLGWFKAKHGNDLYRKQQRVIELIGLLEHKKFLIPAGTGKGSPPFSSTYWSMHELTNIERKGYLFLGKFLGLEFIADATKPNIARIIGTTKSGDESVGTGIMLTPNIVLTCAHVLQDMTISETIEINGILYQVNSFEAHSTIDVGVVIINEALKHEICHDIALRDSTILEKIIISGFPKVPRRIDTSVITQSGKIAGKINSYDHHGSTKLELFTAVAHPGNSGGPLLTMDGKLVGIVTQSLERSEEEADKKNQILPFFAAIPASEIYKAFNELETAKTYQIPWEYYQ